MQVYLCMYFDITCPFVFVIDFDVTGHSIPFRFDRDANRGGIVLYVREDIPANLLITKYAPFKMPLN